MQLQTDRPPGAFSGTSLGVIEQPQTCRLETKTPPFCYKIYIIKSKGLQINDSFANICRAIIYTNTVHSVARERERHREQTSREKIPVSINILFYAITSHGWRGSFSHDSVRPTKKNTLAIALGVHYPKKQNKMRKQIYETEKSGKIYE